MNIDLILEKRDYEGNLIKNNDEYEVNYIMVTKTDLNTIREGVKEIKWLKEAIKLMREIGFKVSITKINRKI